MQNLPKLVFILLASFLPLLPNTSTATNPWSTIDEEQISNRNSSRPIVPNRYLTLHLSMDDLQSILAQASLRFTAKSRQNPIVLHIPMPDGVMERFEILEAPIMHPDLAKKYPMLHSYVGYGIDDPTASLRFDITQFGFHAMVLSGRHGGVYIDPYAQNDTEHYISYYQKDHSQHTPYKCHFKDHKSLAPSPETDFVRNSQGDCMLRTYRLALACTGEYAAFHGGNIPDVMAAFHTTMTRVNGIFERDVAVNLELVANTDELIFLDADSDPYPSSFPTGNQFVCDDIIGSANYDIGHLLGIGDGGSAERSSCCVEGLKAEGYSTLASPVGDGFDINFVAHEFGHQFGCSHTANGNCNNTPSTSVEPGNAYSVMGFDFFCEPIIEAVRGPYFHAINIIEISENIINGPPGSCAMLTDHGNTPPSVEGGNNQYHLPIATPFLLTAEGTDTDGDSLTYCWEQMDNEKAADPPLSTNTAGPAFRSYGPVEAPYRYFPALEYILDGTTYLWEVLPSVSRVMNFRVTARDNFPGGGCTALDDVDLIFTSGAGPFLVQTPNVNETWYQDAFYTISWDVANTDKAPVSCANVDLLLSIDGGYTYPIVLATEVPNDGSHVIPAPQVTSSMARVMVTCSDNVFFDISDNNFSIEMATAPAFEVAIDPPTQEVCGLDSSGTYTLSFSPIAGFNEEITLTATGLPSGASLNFSQNPVSPTASVTLMIEGLANVASGNYSINLVGTTPSTSKEAEIVLVVSNELPASIALSTPEYGAIIEQLQPTFEWEDEGATTHYTFEIATEPTFENLIATSTINVNNYTLSEVLDPLTVYYWRVLPINSCAASLDNIPFFAFQTSGAVCKQFTNVEPTLIPGFLATTSTTLTIEEDFEIVDANISMELFHKFVGDLSATLIAPSGIVIDLFDRPGVPFTDIGCSRDDLLVTFDDEASNTAADFDNTCLTGEDYTIEGTFQPISPLSALDNQSPLGEWTLSIEDQKFSHAGAVDRWTLEFCLEQSAGAIPAFSKMSLFVPDLGTEIVSTENLSVLSSTATAAQITYTLTALPTAGTLLFNGSNGSIGTTFTQEDINNNLLSYTNTNPDALLDQFRFDIETVDGNWIPDEFLTINIGEITRVNEPGTDLNFQLFPNPSNGQITLTLNQSTSSQLSITIYDVIGNLLQTIAVEKTTPFFQQQIDLQNFPSGIYALYLTDGISSGRRIFLKSQ